MQLCQYITGCVSVLLLLLQIAFAEDAVERDEKLISTFQIVRFPNDACVGSNSRNGTCYTSAECSDKSGTSSGSCADGFGVCCTFVVTTCGSSTSENITYWTTASITTGDLTTCGLTVCPVNTDICSLRLDFTTFVITGPNTISALIATKRKFGTPGAADLTDTAHKMTGSSYTTNCLYDSFTAQGASPSSAPPEVCGTLTGTHMYVEADVDRCNNLQFNLGDYAATAALNKRGVSSLTTRSWDITVSQIECASATLPPVGCTQWFWGNGKYVLENYNYRSTSAVTSNAGIHLANQNQRICIRREKGNCVGCFATSKTGFHVSGSSMREAHFTGAGGCCGYLAIPGGGHLASGEVIANHQGTSQIDTAETATSFGLQGFDCIIIPGAFVPATDDGEYGTTAAEADTGTPVVQQTSTVITTYNSEDNYMTPSGPQICGSEGGIGIGSVRVSETIGTGNVQQGIISAGRTSSLTICSRSDPFILEFMSDDIDGQGIEDTEQNSEIYSATQIANLGFSITHTQLECT